MRINILRRNRRVPPPPVSRVRPQEVDPLELLQVRIKPEVKTEPDVLLEELEATPPRPRTKRRDMMQLAERPGRPMTFIPGIGYSRTVRPSGFGHRTVTAAAAASGAAGGSSDSDGDASLADADQAASLEAQLGSVRAQAAEDEELTSLSWLQGRDLLKGIELRPAPEPVSPPAQQELIELIQRETSSEPEEASPTCDYLEEGGGEASPTFGQGPDRFYGPRGNDRGDDYNREDYAYDPKVHSHVKPPFSFSCLIFMAIEDSRCKALPVREIYGWIQDHFPFYQTAPAGWKNSVRHNLSLSKCFRRVDRSPGQRGHRVIPGKGSCWTVEPEYRTGLIQTLNRSPTVHPRWNSVKLLQGPNRRLRVARTTDPLLRGPSWDGRRANKGGADDADADGDSGPNPQLFPFLAARLLSGPDRAAPSPQHAADDPADVPDAPASRLLTPQNIDKTYLRMREGQSLANEGRMVMQLRYGSSSGTKPSYLPYLQPVMMISRSPAEDHTYAFPTEEQPRHARAAAGHAGPAAGPGGPAAGGGSGGGGRHEHGEADSEDEAFSDDSNLSHLSPRAQRGDQRPYSVRSGELTPEEVESADLLLNLAGVSRAGSRAQSPQPAQAQAQAPASAEAPRRRPGRPRRADR